MHILTNLPEVGLFVVPMTAGVVCVASNALTKSAFRTRKKTIFKNFTISLFKVQDVQKLYLEKLAKIDKT